MVIIFVRPLLVAFLSPLFFTLRIWLSSHERDGDDEGAIRRVKKFLLVTRFGGVHEVTRSPSRLRNLPGAIILVKEFQWLPVSLNIGMFLKKRSRLEMDEGTQKMEHGFVNIAVVDHVFGLRVDRI